MTGEHPVTIHSMASRTGRRDKTLDVVPVSENAMTVIATLRDTSVALGDPNDVEVIHDLRLEATVSLPDLTIDDVNGVAQRQPYEQCALTVATLGRLRGLSLQRGYRREVMERLGGTQSCSHFLTLALELSAANVLSIYLRMRATVENTDHNRGDGTWAGAGLDVEPGLVNACLALAEDSPVIRQARGRS